MNSRPKHDNVHRMDRRQSKHHYCWSGMYHVTIRVSDVLRQPLGRVVGRADAPDGSADAPRVELSAVGQMVERELTSSITAHYPMVQVQEHVVMPDHVHCIIAVSRTIVSANGRETHLGQVIAGFKKGCNRRYWELTGQEGTRPWLHDAAQPQAPGGRSPAQTEQRGEPAATGGGVTGAGGGVTDAGGGVAGTADGCPAVYPQGRRLVPSTGSTGRTPLFAYGYVDVMPVDEQQLAVQRQYIRNNPRSRLLRSTNRAWLQSQRLAVATALSVSALRGYLLKERALPPSDASAWDTIRGQLLTVNGYVACDSYGNQQLLSRRLLPVVCHRRDASRFEQQKQRCLMAARDGAVLVSARIAKGEQTIIDEAIAQRLPVALLVDNGFPEKYHPSEKRIQLCADGRLLLLTPWHYQYRHADENISVGHCKTMNCVVQSLCRLNDAWWKEQKE